MERKELQFDRLDKPRLDGWDVYKLIKIYSPDVDPEVRARAVKALDILPLEEIEKANAMGHIGFTSAGDTAAVILGRRGLRFP